MVDLYSISIIFLLTVLIVSLILTDRKLDRAIKNIKNIKNLKHASEKTHENSQLALEVLVKNDIDVVTYGFSYDMQGRRSKNPEPLEYGIVPRIEHRRQ